MNADRLPKVAVLLAAYNGEKHIKEQIYSVLTQVEVNIFIYISIDKSTDRTVEICNNLKNNYKNIFLINEGDQRFGSAGKNFYHLIRKINCENFDFIALCDQDDLWKETKIIDGIKKINKGYDAYSSDVECFWENKKETKIIKKSFPQKEYDYISEPAGPGCTYILNKKISIFLREKVISSEELPFHHDWYIYALARKNKFKWIIDNTHNILYRQHANNQVGANIGIQQKISRIKKVKSGEYKKEIDKIIKSINHDSSFSKNLRKKILLTPFQFRRKKTDSFILFIFCLFGWI